MGKPENVLENEIKIFDDNLPKWLGLGVKGFVLIKDHPEFGAVILGPYDEQMNDVANRGFSVFGNTPFLLREVLEEQPIIFINYLAA